MAIDKLPEDFVDLTKKLMPQYEPVLLKIISYDEIMVPHVEFFKRNVDGGLFCINKSISMEAELRFVEYFSRFLSYKILFLDWAIAIITIRRKIEFLLKAVSILTYNNINYHN